MKPIATILVLTVSLLVLAAGCAKGATATPEDVQSTSTPQVEPTKKLAPQAAPKESEPNPGASPLEPDVGVSPLVPGVGVSPLPKLPEVAVPPEAAKAVERAKGDLASQAGIAVEQTTVIFVQPIEWPDASLGCPQPGMVYAQVITPGFQVVLEAQGKAYDYHTDMGEHVVLCAEVPAPPNIDKPTDGTPWMPVD